MRSSTRVVGTLALVLALLGWARQAEASPILYGITTGEQLITIDTSTGVGTLVGTVGTNMDAFGLAAFNGHLYAFDQQADMIRELNPLTAGIVNSISFGIDLIGEGGMDFRSDGIGFLNSSAGDSASLYAFTLVANSGALVGGQTTAGLDGLSFNSANVLYALGQTPQNNLYTVNTSTGAVSLIGPTGVVGTNSIGGLDFLDDTHLYAVINNGLYLINTATGAATLVGSTGFTGVTGLAFLNTAATPTVPEPSTLVLIGSALAVMARRRYTRK